jgi:hypothetical protein
MVLLNVLSATVSSCVTARDPSICKLGYAEVFVTLDAVTDGKGKGKDKVHPCTGTEALYRPYDSQRE